LVSGFHLITKLQKKSILSISIWKCRRCPPIVPNTL